jgi:hypothetical protein
MRAVEINDGKKICQIRMLLKGGDNLSKKKKSVYNTEEKFM